MEMGNDGSPKRLADAKRVTDRAQSWLKRQRRKFPPIELTESEELDFRANWPRINPVLRESASTDTTVYDAGGISC